MVEFAFFHSFLRRALSNDDYTRELATLENILNSGLLLVPETIILPGEPLEEGRKGNPIQFVQRRLALTLLTPSELPAHASRFGRFTIEFDLADGRQLGAIPVIYLPQPSPSGYGGYQTLDAFGATLIYRLREVFFLLADLATLECSIHGATNSDCINLSTGEGRDESIIGTAEVRKILDILGRDKQPFDDLAAACQVIFHLFYPTDKRRSDLDSMSLNVFYYQQREWRIFSDISVGQQRRERALTFQETTRLCENDDFFAELIETTDPHTNAPVYRQRAELCRLLEHVEGRHPRTFIKRIWVPFDAKHSVTELLRRTGCSMEVVSV
ncbi:hypothetical protein HFO68_34270 [Rhizobium laguerreae]|uniref:hypothetical protein n=1 Tax=Rhizobium laguerreae TaxID=1076926 RepID=UPI001C907812|nr:hypothetical protein [Rhizobium laguerreae]MBY3109532.1 hypothetical protein [Rhizobium laguerreae]